MEITPICKRVIGLDVHQAKISACAVIELADGTLSVPFETNTGFWHALQTPIHHSSPVSFHMAGERCPRSETKAPIRKSVCLWQ